ncbi:DUF2846 domain-containing protein [Kistimonas asteriae]|uniref:DUF2846 domain-containing protein n=1 Tax=Kistimonas asteriae TaxID=517724 RepID=UPI001BAD8CAB|nr:DUF2846 domain-containing protein [Kistimonas asteriae]
MKSLSRISVVLCVLYFLSACSSWDRTFGAYLKPVDGALYATQASPELDNAHVIIYRPYSEWAEEELEAPTVYVNGEPVVNISSNGHQVLELAPGQYQFLLKRPFFGLDLFFLEDSFLAEQPINFNRIASFSLDVAGGGTYYLRYAELTSPRLDPTAGDMPLGDGPMQFVSRSSAKAELEQTRALNPVVVLSAPVQETVAQVAENTSWWWF